VPRRSKHPLSTGHTRHEPSSMIMNVELSVVRVSVSSTVYNVTIGMKMSDNIWLNEMCDYKLDHCNGHGTCEMLTSNETVVYLTSKTDRM
jgi:hypothetical protein